MGIALHNFYACANDTHRSDEKDYRWFHATSCALYGSSDIDKCTTSTQLSKADVGPIQRCMAAFTIADSLAVTMHANCIAAAYPAVVVEGTNMPDPNKTGDN